MANMDEFGGIMDNQDWERQDQIREEIRARHEITIKDNTIKDLQTSNMFLNKQVDNLLKENHDLRRGLKGPDTLVDEPNPAPGQFVPWTKNPDILLKLQELRNAGEQMQKDLHKLRESFKPS